MKKKSFILITVLVALMISVLMSVPTFAAIKLDGNSIVGLNSRLSYEYAYVTLESYNSPDYISVPLESTSIDGLDVGLVAVRSAGGTPEYFLIDGDNLPEHISTPIGDGKTNIVGKTSSWVAGAWSSTNDAFNYPYYDNVHKLYPQAMTVHQSFQAGNVESMTKEQLINKIQNDSFRYAYASDEIIRVNDLYSFAFTSGCRQGSTLMTPPAEESLYTKVVLWTINDKNEIETHSYYSPTIFSTDRVYSTHNVIIASAFPKASGYVMGFEIYPYGVVPIDTKFSFIDSNKTNNAFVVGYLPNSYISARNDISTALPFQYNGANAAYINGNGLGEFLPDNHITIAELSNILAKLLNNGELPTQYITSFENIRPLEWYYKAIACMENLGAYKNIVNTPFDPDKKLTRGEVAQMICNIAKLSQSKGKTFTDLDETHKYYNAITALSNYGIIKGYADGSCCPDALVSRAEVVTMINRFINLNADSNKFDKTYLETFKDIEGHWAENEILIASNNNVKSDSYEKLVPSLSENETEIIFQTDYIKVVISKDYARVTEFYNKTTSNTALSVSLTPWFSYIVLDNKLQIYPAKAEIENERLAITYANGIKAYFIVEAFDNYFTVELDNDLPIGVKYINYANFSTSESTDEYRLSAVPMATSATNKYITGGIEKQTSVTTYRATGKAFGSKVGIVFSPYKNHREILKETTNAIDIKVGIKSSKGGAFTYDKGNEDLFGDYVILSDGLNPDNAEETAALAKMYSVDQIDIHQGGPRTFVQGGFSFTCAKQDGDGDFISAALFKERIGDKITSQGIQLGLHTYSTLVDAGATNILTNPTYQKQFEFVDQDYKLSEDMAIDATVIVTDGDTSNFTGYFNDINHGVNYYWNKSGFILVDEEIMKVDKAADGKITVQRAKLGTIASEHKAGARINQFRSTYNQLQPVPGSDLYWHIADLTAQAYNDGGFEMIYLDGFESINTYIDNDLNDFYYSEFIRRILEKCEKDPILEASAFPNGMWAARGRGGALDHPNRSYDKFIDAHRSYNENFEKHFYTSTLGWFAYAPDSSETYKNTFVKTLFRDNIDHLGATAVAFNMSTVVQPFSVDEFNSYNQLADNVKYYNVYTRLRKGNYFSDRVREKLKTGLKNGKDYKIVKTNSGKWAFKEMYYASNVIRDMADSTFVTGKGNNPYNAQTPFIRIEQRYSANSATTGETLVLALDETANITTLAKTHTTSIKNLSSKQALKVKVYGNNSSDGILICLTASTATNNKGRADFLIPLNFSGWREITLLDWDNADYDGYSFANVYSSNLDAVTFRAGIEYNKIDTIKITLSGSCTGVKIDDIRAIAPVNAAAKNPSVTIGSNTIKFNTTLKSGDYIEYYPEVNKAYHNYYNGNNLAVKEITFTGSITVPAGSFSYKYSATPVSTSAPLRAKVTIGTSSATLIENESTWTAPDVEIPQNWEKVQLH